MWDWVIAFLMVFTGMMGLAFAYIVYSARLRTRDWPTVPGRIVDRGLGEPTGGDRTSYPPRVRYTYSVGETQYESGQVYVVGRIGGRRNQITRFVNSLPADIPVHYNPDNPSESYLLPNAWWHMAAPALVGGLALTLGLMQVFNLLARAQGLT